jgi:hypothetical protein|tara:strand:+ start:645 stop:1712 length:1068 start_codon:yes stop_codon:yes gene_type:complete
MIKRLLSITMLLGMFTTPAFADYTMIIPQKPGGGTSQWAQIVATEMEKYLDGEKIILKHIPGAREIPGFNKFHNEHRFDDKTIMVSNGGNGVSFLNEKVDYNYKDYDSIGLMNLNIIIAVFGDHDPYGDIPTSFSGGGGKFPDGIAITLLKCGNLESTEAYIACFKEKVNWIKGMKGNERRLAFKRGELHGTRENPASFKKHVQPVIDEGDARLWFHHGILQPDGTHADDPNYPGIQMEQQFVDMYGEEPNSELYDAYKLVKSFRDGLQKALWVNKDNPNRAKLIAALEKVSTNPESIKKIQKKVGKYEWMLGDAGNAQVDTLMTFVTTDSLQTLVQFNTEAFGIKAIYKPELVK